MQIDERFKPIASDVVVAAGAILRRGAGNPLVVEHKDYAELVTQVDRDSEQVMIAMLREALPDHAICSEESGTFAGTSGFTWVLDPLDGTTNYAHGLPLSAVSLGLYAEAELVLAAVYDPWRDELFLAQQGAGAWCNGLPIRVSSCVTVNQALLSAGFPHDSKYNLHNNVHEFGFMHYAAQSVVRLGSAALGLAYVAMGRLDGFWGLRLNVWDTSACLLVHEAGGRISTWDGHPWNATAVDLVSSNGHIHPELIGLLQSAALTRGSQ